MARKKHGSITATINRAETSAPIHCFVARYSGMPISAAAPKQPSCRFVKFIITLVLIFRRSFDTGTEIAITIVTKISYRNKNLAFPLSLLFFYSYFCLIQSNFPKQFLNVHEKLPLQMILS